MPKSATYVPASSVTHVPAPFRCGGVAMWQPDPDIPTSTISSSKYHQSVAGVCRKARMVMNMRSCRAERGMR